MLTAEQIAALPSDTPVTVTLSAPEGPDVLHLRFRGEVRGRVVGEALPRLFLLPDTATGPGVQRWFEFGALHSAGHVPGQSRALDLDRGWQVSTMARQVLLRDGGTGWSVQPLTEQGQEWAAAHEPLSARRDRLLAQVRDLDPALAERMDTLLDDVEEDGYTRGQESGQGYGCC